MVVIRHVHLSQPRTAQVLLMENPDRDAVVSAFRSGAQGLFCQSHHPFQLLCRCVQAVHQGQIWIGNDHLRFLIDAVTHVPGLRVVNSQGSQLLTPREEQVVALAADGLSNREIAQELGLSEHTVKKYLFRIFEKVGVSNRVELVLYAVNHAPSRQAEWIAAASQ
jgi:DNA-binding NarL/FixJ family response regulator